MYSTENSTPKSNASTPKAQSDARSSKQRDGESLKSVLAGLQEAADKAKANQK